MKLKTYKLILFILANVPLMLFSQQVGITNATTFTPNYLLHIHENNATGSVFQLTNTTSGTATTDGFHINLNTSFKTELINKENADISFSTNNSERMKINGSGQIIINNASTTSSGPIVRIYGNSYTALNATYNATYPQALLGTANYGVYGTNNGTIFGYLGGSSYGAFGTYNGTVSGYLGGSSFGAYGTFDGTKYGFLGGVNCGTYGQYDINKMGYLGGSDCGAYAQYSTTNYSYLGYNNGTFNIGVYGKSNGGVANAAGVIGEGNSSSWGALGYTDASLGNYAGLFSGNVKIIGNIEISGSISKGSGSFLIDHPLDPLNKTLRHNFVESPENLCLYRGKVQLDNSGKGIVKMPDYFTALTKENGATVSLTVIGEHPFLTSYKWNDDYTSFAIYGDSNGEVSYQVLADRDDPVMHQLYKPVEEEKGNDNFEKGKLLYPKAFGYPENMGVDYKNQIKKKL